jgi:hypothetical protein
VAFRSGALSQLTTDVSRTAAFPRVLAAAAAAAATAAATVSPARVVKGPKEGRDVAAALLERDEDDGAGLARGPDRGRQGAVQVGDVNAVGGQDQVESPR